ncbi:MAG: class I SAM-dependent methyltransferase [Opitutales bacterium]|nr:class I SAM-dependent methyltransferase [Opitutales bacterium]
MKQDSILARILRRIGHNLITLGSETVDPGNRDFRWGEPSTEEEAVEFLVERVKAVSKKNNISTLLLLGPKGKFAQNVLGRLDSGLSIESLDSVDELMRLPKEHLLKALIIISSITPRVVHELVLALLQNKETEHLPVEYVVVPVMENQGIDLMWEDSSHFLSPLSLQKKSPYDIFNDSLDKFEAKTGVRDYLDLLQCINHVVSNDVSGAIAEFGSFKGQSGYLIRRHLDEIKSNKKLYLFDMFESFPYEKIGIDHFWSETHEVDFEEVKSKFTSLDNVNFVQGEFSKTLPESDCNELALAFVDCDAYRSTKYLIEEIFDKRLSPGGIMIFEDYGHSNLLGNRLAVHECFDNKQNVFQFFSHFSGSYIVCKTTR